MASEHAQALVDAALPYWEAEAEIAKRFFASSPSGDAQQQWLRQIASAFRGEPAFADILAFLSGTALDIPETAPLRSELLLAGTRRQYVDSGNPIDAAAIAFTDGGGGRLLREGSKISGGELEGRVAHALAAVYLGEREHFRRAPETAAAVIHTPADLSRMVAAITAIAKRRVEMCREMFGSVMTQAEVAAFIGRIKMEVAGGNFVATE